MSLKDKILEALIEIEKSLNQGVAATDISDKLNLNRANVSRVLNQLALDKKIEKIQGRPVLFKQIKRNEILPIEESLQNAYNIDKIIGAKYSLQLPIQQAKAAILYPPFGLHTLLLGETGVGKSMFAELMYRFAIESNTLKVGAPFILFNCADYAENPQLLIGHIFGVKKGAYTGADRDKDGLLKKANGGMIFLDEVHRLSPQGQEMLFTFIDKGSFRPLGDADSIINVSVQIIAATTEEPESYLLKTFIRRIPMIITLPSLINRGLKEKYAIIEIFVKEESKRVGKSIYINRNALTCLLLYDCIGNIGQLKSDIQLCCARGFLNYKSGKKEYIIITQEDLPRYVKKGILKVQDKREEVNNILKNGGDILRFHYGESIDDIEDINDNEEDFYDSIEKKLYELKSRGIEEGEINHILDINLQDHFEKYLKDAHEKTKRYEILKLVGEEIVEIVEYVLDYASKKLNRVYNENIYFALGLHLNGSIKRIINGNKIYNPKLNSIRVNHMDEFFTAMEVAKEIDKKFNIETPLDEIGYLTLFLCYNSPEYKSIDSEGVGILLILHGNSTATSMAQVANSLVGIDYVVPMDMSLSISAEHMYSLAKERVQAMNHKRGILFMVDMGSLVNFGDMIYEDTGIIVKTIDMVSTPMVIEACRKATSGRELQEIYQCCKDISGIKRIQVKKTEIKKKNIILAACFTGEGAAERLKRILLEKLDNYDDLDIIAVNILNRKEFLTTIDYYREKHKVLVVVGTIPVEIEGIPFVSAIEILSGQGVDTIKQIIEGEHIYDNIALTLKEHLIIKDAWLLLDNVRNFIEEIKNYLNININSEVEIGIILHICFMIDNIKNGKRKKVKSIEIDEYENRYSREIVIIEDCIRTIEEIYEIHVDKIELVYLSKMFLCNNEENSTQK